MTLKKAMTLKVIGAGFGRTGTESMKRALEILGLGPCYHMYEVLPSPERVALWRGIASGQIAPDWDAVFDGYQATVDWPGMAYWQQLAAHFPEAKILLTTRSKESWIASMEKTILKVLRDPDEDPESIGQVLIRAQTFGGDLDDIAHVAQVYDTHNQTVRDSVPAHRLVDYPLGSGWEPLCAALDLPVPDVPYPSGNKTDEFHARLEENIALRDRREQGDQ